MAIIEIKDLSVSYQNKQALDQISLAIPDKKITAIIGPSGCGKTTLLHCINRLIDDTKQAQVAGDIWLDGQSIKSVSLEELRKKVGLVFQTPAPFPFSIYKNMIYGPRYYGVKNRGKLQEIVRDKLVMAGLYDEVKDDLNRNARKLSGGQQQRLCIARALTVDPEVLLLDEPCSALDVVSTENIENMLMGLKESLTIVLVTHNIAQARRIADQVVFLQNGRLVEYGPARQVFTNPKKEETRAFLGGMLG